MIGLYVHVPFCARKCPYCAFYSGAYSKKSAEAFTDAALRNILSYEGRGVRADTLYLGGGTPSLLSPAQVESIISAAEQAFALDVSTAEITLECNPCTVTPEKLRQLRQAGVNRLSVGFQSADGGELALLGRLHTAQRGRETVLAAAEAGFENISCDLMLGLPDQTGEKLCRSISALAALPIQHISAYILKVEEGTEFSSSGISAALPSEDETAALYLETVRLCEAAGFRQYEISNFARHGAESRHNLKYWRCEEYIGIGPAAHSFFGGRRFACPESIEDFITAPTQRELITDPAPDPAEEYIMLGLRLREGIDLDKAARLGFSPRDPARLRALVQGLSKAGLCISSGSRLSLTPKGMLVSNSVISELLSL
ncbi:MAG: radical SAM family heme chaperone HemW [Ruminococcus sp.]|nr:radical SAM family heme chaperone HemW [Ruminococcus sp.]